MKFLLLPLAVMLLSSVCQALEEGTHIWILKTDPKTADSITGALENNEISSDKFDEVVTKLIKGRKVEVIARALADNSITERQNFDELTEVFSFRDAGEINQMGRFIGLETIFDKSKTLCYPDIHYTSLSKLDSSKFQFFETFSSYTIQVNRWSLAGFSREGDSVILTLVNAATNQAGPQAALPAQESLIFELYEVSNSDIEKFNKSTPNTRQKAIAWLKSRGTEIYVNKIASASGEHSMHQNRVCWVYEDAGSYSSAQMGYISSIHSVQTSYERDSLFVWTKVEWSIPDKPKLKPDYDFRIKSKLSNNEAKVFFPTTLNNDANKNLALVITATISGPENTALSPYSQSSSAAAYTQQYIVPVNFINALQERYDKKNPHPGKDTWEHGVISPTRVKDLLISESINFPDKANATLSSRNSILTLYNTKEGHDAFKKLLEGL